MATLATPWHRDVIAPAAVLCAIMIAHTILETARDALFLSRLGPDDLAWVYLAMAALALLVFAALRRWAGVRDPRRLLLAFLVIAAVGTGVFAATITVSSLAVFALYVWTGLIVTMIVPMFWTMLDRSLRITEAKRVFALIGAGGVLGAMVGSAIASVLGRFIATQHLVVAGAIAYAVAAIAAFSVAPKATVAEAKPRQQQAGALSRRSARYMKLLVALGLVSTIALTLGDLVFKRAIAEHLPARQLATAFGAIYASLNAIGLIVQLVVTPRLLARFGVGGALTLLPLVLASAGFGFAFTGAIVAIVTLRVADGGLRNSLHRIGTEILYLPVPAAVRDVWKPVVDVVGLRGGEALAATVVFAMGAAGLDARLLAGVAAIAAVLWLLGIAITHRAYVAQFRATLRAGEIQHSTRVPDLDASSTEMLNKSLSSPDEIEALAALDMLAWQHRFPALIFYHPSVRVVRRALSLLEGDLRPDIARVLEHLVDHSDSRIRAAALAALARTNSNRAPLIAAITSDNVDVRSVAMVSLANDPMYAEMASRGIDALGDGSTADRTALARAIEYNAAPQLGPLLYRLLDHHESSVMRHVLRTLARTPALANLDRLLPQLANPHVRSDVRHVFTATGQRGFDYLIAALDEQHTPVEIRCHLPRTIEQFGSRPAAAVLAAHLVRESDGTTEFKLLRSLGRLRSNDPRAPIDHAAMHKYAQRTLAEAARYATLHDYFGADVSSESARLIGELLREKRDASIERVFRAVDILRPHTGLHSIHDAIQGSDEARRSAAHELVESLVPSELRSPLLALLDPLSPDERRQRLDKLAVGPFDTYDASLIALLTDASDSLRCVAAYHIASRRLVHLRVDLLTLRPTIGPTMVCSAFDQAIARLDA